MEYRSLNDLFIHELRDLYSAEQQILQALPMMAQAASSQDLKMAFQEHLQQTQQQVGRLQTIFDRLRISPDNVTCKGMQGLIQEGQEILRGQGDPMVRDAALIGAAQKVEHYEIAGYGTARALAQQLDFQDIASMLDKTLDEEGSTDKKLTKLATGGLLAEGINERAASR